jgi:hypothetical protein
MPVSFALRQLAAWITDAPGFRLAGRVPSLVAQEVEARLSPLDGYPDAVAALTLAVLGAVRNAVRGESLNPDAMTLAAWLSDGACDDDAGDATEREVHARLDEFTGEPAAVVVVVSDVLHSLRPAVRIDQAELVAA